MALSPVQALDTTSALKQRSDRAVARVSADVWPHPLTAEGRALRTVALAPGSTLAELIAQEWPGGSIALKQRSDSAEVTIDGLPVPRAAWAETPLREGQIVTLRAALAGGGGDKNPLAAILQIGVLVAAIVVPPLLFASSWAQALTGAAITVTGGLIVNALAPPRGPDAALPQPGPAAEPLYSLSAGANRARAYAPLLLVLGAHRVFPDLGAAEYTEVAGGEQYLHQIFNFGLGSLAIDDLRIGDTPLATFDEVETEFANAHGEIALVAGNVDSEAGAALEDTAFVERTTGRGTRRIGIDLAGRIFRVNEQGDIIENSVEVEIEWEPADGSGPVARRTVTLASGTQTPYRRTLTYDLSTPRAWTVRVRRTADPDASDRVYDDLSWAALRAYQLDPADYRGQTRLGLRIRASGQLSGRLDRVSAMVRQRVPDVERPAVDPAASLRQPGMALSLVRAGRARGGAPRGRPRPRRRAHRRGLDQGLGRLVRGAGPGLQPRPRPRDHARRGAGADRAVRACERELADRHARRGVGGGRAAGHGADRARQHPRRLLRRGIRQRPRSRRDRRPLHRARSRLAVQHAAALGARRHRHA